MMAMLELIMLKFCLNLNKSQEIALEIPNLHYLVMSYLALLDFLRHNFKLNWD